MGDSSPSCQMSFVWANPPEIPSIPSDFSEPNISNTSDKVDNSNNLSFVIDESTGETSVSHNESSLGESADPNDESDSDVTSNPNDNSSNESSWNPPYIDENGKGHKPFVVPQHTPDFYQNSLTSYNVPEFIKEPVTIDKKVIVETAREGQALKVAAP